MADAESEVLLLLDIEHQNIARVLEVLERELDRIAGGAPADAPLLKDIAEYFLSFPDECHHPKEDLIVDRLLAAAPAAAERIGGLKEEHERLAATTRRLAGLAIRMAAEPETTTPAFAEQARAFIGSYRDHMQGERTTLFPEARRVLSDDDWRAIDFDIFDRPDPLFSEAAERSFGLLRDRIVRESGPRGTGGPAP